MMATVSRGDLQPGDILIQFAGHGGFELARVEDEVRTGSTYTHMGAHRARQTAEMAACELCESGRSVWLAVDADTFVRIHCDPK